MVSRLYEIRDSVALNADRLELDQYPGLTRFDLLQGLALSTNRDAMTTMTKVLVAKFVHG